MDDALRN